MFKAVALSSYQGGHNEYFAYIRQLLDERGGKDIKIFGGGGGVITPEEIEALEQKGITKIYHPKDGVAMGLEGIIDDMIKRSNFSTTEGYSFKQDTNFLEVAKVVTYIEEMAPVAI